MSAAFSIEDGTGIVATTAATLPLRTIEADGKRIRVVAGTTGWPARVADAVRDADGVLLVEPVPETADAVRGLDADVPVVVDAGWATTAAADLLGDEFGEYAASGDLVEVHSSVESPDDVARCVLAQVTLLRSVGLTVVAAERIVDTDRSTVHRGETANGLHALLVVRVTTAGPPRTEVRVVGASGTVSADLPDPSTAAPTRVRTVTERGDLLHPTVYESGHRVALARLLDAVNSGSAGDDLDALADDTRTVARASG